MAASYTDVISLNDVKQQLGLNESETSQDNYISGLIAAAITSIEKSTGLTLIDKTTTEKFYPDNAYKIISLISDGIVLDASDDTITEAMFNVYYYDHEQNQQSYNCKVVRGSSPTLFNQECKLFPPDEGWQFGIGNTPFGTQHSINLTLKGPDGSDVPPPLKQAALLIIDLLYHGSPLDDIPSHNAVGILLSAYKKIVIS